MKRLIIGLVLAAVVLAWASDLWAWGWNAHYYIPKYCRQAWGLSNNIEDYGNTPDTWGNFDPPVEEDGSNRGLSTNTPDEHAVLFSGTTYLLGTAHRNASAYARNAYGTGGTLYTDKLGYASHYVSDILNPYHTTLNHQGVVGGAVNYSIYSGTYSLRSATTATGITGDDAGKWISLTGLSGGGFNFYGTKYTQVWVCSNGFISFKDASTAYSPAAIPNTAAPNALAAPFWRDLNPTGGAIYYSISSAEFVVYWSGVKNYANSNQQWFQIILQKGDPDQVIFQYQTISNDVSTSYGVENADGTKGNALSGGRSYNSAFVFVPYGENGNHYGYEKWVNDNWFSGYNFDATAKTASGYYWHTDNIRNSTYNNAYSNSYNNHDAVASAYESGNWSTLANLTRTQISYACYSVGGLVEYARARANGGSKSEPVGGGPSPIPEGMTHEAYLASLSAPKTENVGPTMLLSVAPNPVRDHARVSYQLASPAQVSIKVYNIQGQLVKILASETKPAGYHSVTWDGKDANGNKVAAGVYLYRMSAGEYSATKKLTVIR
jgi:hypothetical protein